MAKYSDDLTSWLCDLGYTSCFFVAGGNIMHLIESFSKKLIMIPVIHEVAAVIATDYFNETSSASNFENGKALALVTAGPGVTNVLTGVASAYIDSRELLIIGGQVKSNDLKLPHERQRGIQEIDGVSILSNVTKSSVLLNKRMTEDVFKNLVTLSGTARKGPVYLEICLDVQGSLSNYEMDFVNFQYLRERLGNQLSVKNEMISGEILDLVEQAARPLFLIGGGFPRSRPELVKKMEEFGIPCATTWHGADRIKSDSDMYAGRPNMFGQRWANMVIQQSDLIIVLGSTLGVQQTGFNLEEFAPKARILQVDIDEKSFKTMQFKNLVPVQSSIDNFIQALESLSEDSTKVRTSRWKEWGEFIRLIRQELPLVEQVTDFSDRYVNPFRFIEYLSHITPSRLNFVPCSSGGSYTSSMQVFEQKQGNLILSSRGLGSMGVGVAGAIGAAIANGNLTWLIEGDGGILQNIQELSVIAIRSLPIKIIIFGNDGYASIRSTQKKYFAGNYVGCDRETGLGIPDFPALSQAFGIRFIEFGSECNYEDLKEDLLSDEPLMVYVSVHPDQPFLPKIESRLGADGSMESNPLHIMYPAIEQEVSSKVIRFIEKERVINE